MVERSRLGGEEQCANGLELLGRPSGHERVLFGDGLGVGDAGRHEVAVHLAGQAAQFVERILVPDANEVEQCVGGAGQLSPLPRQVLGLADD